MNLRTAAGSLSRFAHLAGIRAASKAEDESDKDKDEKKDGDKDAKRAEDEGSDEDTDAKGAKAEDGDPDKKDDGEGDKKDAKAADESDKDEDGKDDDGDDKDEDKDAKKARASERSRCARIFGSSAAASNIALAAELAFGTGLSSRQAIALLRAGSAGLQAAAGRTGLSARMASVPPINVGAGDAGARQPGTKAEEARAQATAVLAQARAAGAKF